MIRKRLITFLLVISLASSTFLPVFTPRAHAIFGIGDLVIDVKALAERFIDGIFMALAQRMIDDMVQSTITWANEGFEGGPAYVTDPGSYFTNIADQTAGSFIQSSDLGFLCSPFQNSIRFSLAYNYGRGGDYRNISSCSITGIKGNIEDFYSDFSQGGWDTWFSITQNDSNNPYGAYLGASAELDSRLQNKLGIENKKLDWSQGFKSKGDCLIRNPESPLKPDGSENLLYNSAFAPGECMNYGPDKTPGSIIKSQLDEVLPSGLEKLITAQHVDQLVSAFTQGLLTRYVFSDDGLFSSSYDDTFKNSSVFRPINGPEVSAGWTYCANEGEFCEFSGTRTVRYGSGDKSVTKTFTDGVSCSNANFGDPSVNVSKWCEFSTTEIVSSDPQNEPLNPALPLSVSCRAVTTVASVGETVEWMGDVSGGSGDIGTILWSGNDTSAEDAEAWRVFTPITTSSGNSKTIFQLRSYDTPGSKTASLTIIDADNNVTSAAEACSGSIEITP